MVCKKMKNFQTLLHVSLIFGENETTFCVIETFSLSLESARAHLIDSPPIYNADYGYKSWEAYSNLSYYTRTLPPVPHDCPTPMGVAGESQTCSLTFLSIYLLLRHYITDRRSAQLADSTCASACLRCVEQKSKRK